MTKIKDVMGKSFLQVLPSHAIVFPHL